MKIVYMRQGNADKVIKVIRDSMRLQNAQCKLDLKVAGIKNYEAIRLKQQKVREKYHNLFIVHQNLELFFFGYDARDAKQSIEQELIQLGEINRVIKIQDELVQIQFSQELKNIRDQLRQQFDVHFDIEDDQIIITGQPLKVERATQNIKERQSNYGSNVIVKEEWKILKNLQQVYREEIEKLRQQFKIRQFANDLIMGIGPKFQDFQNAVKEFHMKKYQKCKIQNVENISQEELKDLNLQANATKTKLKLKNKTLTITGYEAQIFELRVKKHIEINALMKQEAKLREEKDKLRQESDKLKNDLGKNQVQYPNEWTNFPHQNGSNLCLENIQQGSVQWNFVTKLFNATVNNQVVAITRIQNIELWQRFYYQSLLMQREKKALNKRWMFHGTRQNKPEDIYGQKFGFDFRFSRNGAWGVGAYFAQNASYSHGYRHALQNGRSCMFLACVLQGDPFKSGGDGNLKMPPKKPGLNEQYDSVSSIDGSIVIVYEHGKAYPFYLIEYN